MANSQDRELRSISVDSSLFIHGKWSELKSILFLEKLKPKDYCFVSLSVEEINKYNNQNNAVANLSVEHTPKISRCSHCDIIIDTEGKMKPGSILSNAKFKKLRRSLAKMVHEIIFDNKIEKL